MQEIKFQPGRPGQDVMRMIWRAISRTRLSFRRHSGWPGVRRVACIAGLAAAFSLSISVADVIPASGALDDSSIPAPNADAPPKIRELLLRATAALVQSNFTEAEALARQVIEEAPEAPDGWHILGYTLANVERYDEALEALDKAAALYIDNVDPLVTQGEIHEFLGRREEAREAFQKAVELDATSWLAHQRLGAMAREDGEYDKAISHFRRAIDEGPEDRRVEAGLEVARIQAKQGQPEQSLETLREMTRVAPNSREAWEGLGRAQLSMSLFQEAISSLERAAELAPDEAGILAPLATSYRARGQLGEERAVLLRALDLLPGDPTINARLGRNAIDNGHVDTAIKYYEAAVLRLAPDELGAKQELAAAYLEADRPEAAQTLLAPWAAMPDGTPGAVIALLGRAAEDRGDRATAQRYFEARITPDADLGAYLDLGSFHRRGLDFVSAERVLKQAAAAYPESSLPWHELGRTYGGERRYDAALEAFHKGLEITPDAPSLLKGASLTEFRMGRLDAAHDLASKLISREDVASSDYAWLGSLEEARGNESLAVDAYQAAVDMDPSNWLAQNNLAALIADEDPARALVHARAAAEQAGSVAAVRDTLGWALFRNGDSSGAHRIFSELADEAPENPTAAYRLGRVLLEMGKDAEGRAQLRRALELDPAFSNADDARQRLAN